MISMLMGYIKGMFLKTRNSRVSRPSIHIVSSCSYRTSAHVQVTRFSSSTLRIMLSLGKSQHIVHILLPYAAQSWPRYDMKVYMMQ